MRTDWDCIVTAEEAGCYKPDPRPYRLALATLGVAPEDAAFVVGSGYDLFGTSAVGLRTYWHNRVGLSRPDGAPVASPRAVDARRSSPPGWKDVRHDHAPTVAHPSRRCCWRPPPPRPRAFPTKPLTLIVPFPAGGPSDALARALAQGMAADLKQTVVVENIAAPAARSGSRS